jgi:hypothetical protein
MTLQRWTSFSADWQEDPAREPRRDRHGSVRPSATEHEALVVGDVLLGAGAKPRPTDDPLRLCPERWLGGHATHEDLKRSLRPLLEQPLEQILVSHGAPVTRQGSAALAAVLA